MPELHLRQPVLTYSACGPFTEHREKIKEFKVTGDLNYIYKNELDKILKIIFRKYFERQSLWNCCKS